VKILDRYIVRELIVPFVLGLAVFTSILLIVRILKLVELVVNRGVPIGQVLRLFSYILPAFLEVTVPMALLLAILVAFGRLSSDSEIVALRAAGRSLEAIRDALRDRGFAICKQTVANVLARQEAVA